MKGEPTWPTFDRRRGPRRTHAEGTDEAAGERRQTDRRKNKPGISALWQAITGMRDEGDSAGP